MLDLILSTQTMARPFATAPSVPPPERVMALRKVFMDLTSDPAFIAATKEQQLELEPVSGGKIQEVVARISKTPKPVIRKMRDVVLGLEASTALGK